MKSREVLSLSFIGWYLLIPPVFSPMGEHSRSFNDLTAPLNKWDIWARFDSRSSCNKEKEHLVFEAPIRLKFAREHPDRMPTATSSPCQKLGNMRIASPPIHA
jgi:hypothetical protein